MNTTSDGRQPEMEDNLKWKTTPNGRQPQMEDNLKYQICNSSATTEVEVMRQNFKKLQTKTTFDGR